MYSIIRRKKRIKINEIPNDCLGHILLFIDSVKDFNSIILTFKGLLEHVRVYSASTTRNIPFRVKLNYVDFKDGKFEDQLHVSNLCFRRTTNHYKLLQRHGFISFPDMISSLLSFFPNLLKLNLTIINTRLYSSQIVDLTTFDMFLPSNHLKTLSMRLSHVNVKISSIESNRSLLNLLIRRQYFPRNPFPIPDNDLLVVEFKKFPKLRSISFLRWKIDQKFTIFSEVRESLFHLHLDYCTFSNEFFELEIVDFPVLRTLRLGNRSMSHLRKIEKSPKLRVVEFIFTPILELHDLFNEQYLNGEFMIRFQNLQHLPGLERVYFGSDLFGLTKKQIETCRNQIHCRSSHEDGLFLNNLHSLTVLDLLRCNFDIVLSNMKHLGTIKMERCKSLDLRELADVPNLKHVHLCETLMKERFIGNIGFCEKLVTFKFESFSEESIESALPRRLSVKFRGLRFLEVIHFSNSLIFDVEGIIDSPALKFCQIIPSSNFVLVLSPQQYIFENLHFFGIDEWNCFNLFDQFKGKIINHLKLTGIRPHVRRVEETSLSRKYNLPFVLSKDQFLKSFCGVVHLSISDFVDVVKIDGDFFNCNQNNDNSSFTFENQSMLETLEIRCRSGNKIDLRGLSSLKSITWQACGSIFSYFHIAECFLLEKLELVPSYFDRRQLTKTQKQKLFNSEKQKVVGGMEGEEEEEEEKEEKETDDLQLSGKSVLRNLPNLRILRMNIFLRNVEYLNLPSVKRLELLRKDYIISSPNLDKKHRKRCSKFVVDGSNFPVLEELIVEVEKHQYIIEKDDIAFIGGREPIGEVVIKEMEVIDEVNMVEELINLRKLKRIKLRYKFQNTFLTKRSFNEVTWSHARFFVKKITGVNIESVLVDYGDDEGDDSRLTQFDRSTPKYRTKEYLIDSRKIRDQTRLSSGKDVALREFLEILERDYNEKVIVVENASSPGDI